jgi:hypothetical protein
MRAIDDQQQRLLDIIDLVYEGVEREQMLAALFTELRQLFTFSSGVLLPIDPGTFELQGTFSFDCPSENTEPYLQHYAAFDPYVCRPPDAVPINRTVRFSDIARPRQIDCSEFADFMAKVPYRHALAAVVGLDGQPMAAFSVHRRKDQRDFGSKEVAVFDRIAPHLGRALAWRSCGTIQPPSAGVGLLVVGATGRGAVHEHCGTTPAVCGRCRTRACRSATRIGTPLAGFAELPRQPRAVAHGEHADAPCAERF